MKPILKWVGGKTQILDTVLSLFPRTMEHYHEPFVGGGSVLLGLLSAVQERAVCVKGTIYASDINPNLIAFYKNIQQNPDALIGHTKTLVEEYRKATGNEVNRKATTLEEALTAPESYYFWIRSRFNALKGDDRTTPLASAMLLFLNKTCFRGLYREGPKGFNVPYGNYKNPAILDEDHIRSVSNLIQGVVFTCAPFSVSLANVSEGSFVYLDPPYAPESETSFVGYTADGFGLEQHTALFTLCKGFAAKGVRMLMSNADVKLVRDAFPAPSYTTQVIQCKRAIHSKKPGSITNEVLIH